jgi:scyllo-inositol 2-dehydrogenase (NADP+)
MKKKNGNELKVGVIGYGGAFNMGRTHLREMQSAGMTPHTVVEIDPLRLQAADDDFPGLHKYTSVDAMLKESEVDLVTIITPHNSHAPLALKCLKAGKHVICEKPMAITTQECDTMIAAARKQGLLLSAYHNRHWDGGIMRAVDEIRNKNVIGEVYRIDAHMGQYGQPKDWWRSSRSISGGILYDWGVHLLEYSLQLIDSPLVEVSGYAKTGHWAQKTAWKHDTIEDESAAILRFKNGVWLTLSFSHLDSNPRPSWMEVFGTEGAYSWTGDEYTVIKMADGITRTEKGRNPKSEGQRYYENVMAHLTRREKLVITAEWSRRPIHAIDLAVLSGKRGRSLPAKYP